MCHNKGGLMNSEAKIFFGLLVVTGILIVLSLTGVLK